MVTKERERAHYEGNADLSPEQHFLPSKKAPAQATTDYWQKWEPRQLGRFEKPRRFLKSHTKIYRKPWQLTSEERSAQLH